MKKVPWYIVIFHLCTIYDDHLMYGSGHMELEGHFLFWLWANSCPFIPLMTKKSKTKEKERKKKNSWRCYHFTRVYHKWWWHDLWFQRNGVQGTTLFVILRRFLPFYSLNNLKIQLLKKWKKYQETKSFYTSGPKNMIICYTVPKIWCLTDIISAFHFSLFSFFLPREKSNFLKNKISPRRYHHFTHVY